jgi:PAS domain S-box-containing protein
MAFGYRPEELVGQPVEVLIPGYRSAYSLDPGSSVMGEGMELFGFRKDGTEFPTEVSLGPVQTREGAFILATIRDITERSKARERLRASEERIRLLMDSMTEGIYAIDESGRGTLMNSSGLQLLGYTLEEVMGMDIHALLHSRQCNGHCCSTGQCFFDLSVDWRHEAHSDEEILWRSDGISFPAECWAHPIHRNGEVIGRVVSFLDITRRKEIDQERQRFEDILEAAPALVGIARALDGAILYVNPAGRKMLGIGDDEDISKLVFSRDFRTESNRQCFLASAMPALKREGVWCGESVYTSRAGQDIPVLQELIAHKGRDGKTEYLSSIAYDITAQKQAERQREMAESQLRHAQKMQSIGQLAAGIAHEINTPMQYIGDSLRFLADSFHDMSCS